MRARLPGADCASAPGRGETVRLARFGGGSGWVRLARFGAGRRVVRRKVGRVMPGRAWFAHCKAEPRRVARFKARPSRRGLRYGSGRAGRARFAHCKAGIGTVSGASEPGWSRVAFCVGRRGLRVLGRAELKKTTFFARNREVWTPWKWDAFISAFVNRRFASWQIIPLIDAACFRGLWTNQASIAPRFAHGEGARLFCQCGAERRGTRAACSCGKRGDACFANVVAGS